MTPSPRLSSTSPANVPPDAVAISPDERAARLVVAAERYGERIFNHAIVTEDERLTALTEELDADSFRRLEALPIRANWRCLELGAGTGTAARWLADRCPDSSVVATDLDLKLVHAQQGGHPNLTWLHHDLTRQEFPPGSFDLIHARYVFCHLPSRQRELTRVIQWLAPGGWLVLEEPALFPIESSPDHCYRMASLGVFTVLGQRIGSDCVWPRTLSEHLRGVGLTEVDTDVTQSVVGNNQPMSRFWRLTLKQLAPALCAIDGITDVMVTEAMAKMSDPHFRDLGMATVGAWGRRLAS